MLFAQSQYQRDQNKDYYMVPRYFLLSSSKDVFTQIQQEINKNRHRDTAAVIFSHHVLAEKYYVLT